MGALFTRPRYWADRWSRTRLNSPVLVPLIGLIVAAPAILLATSTDYLPLAIVGLMIFGLTKSFSDANMMPILTLISDRRYRATGYEVLNMCACLVGGLTIYAGGALRDAKSTLARSSTSALGASPSVPCSCTLYTSARLRNLEA